METLPGSRCCQHNATEECPHDLPSPAEGMIEVEHCHHQHLHFPPTGRRDVTNGTAKQAKKMVVLWHTQGLPRISL